MLRLYRHSFDAREAQVFIVTLALFLLFFGLFPRKTTSAGVSALAITAATNAIRHEQGRSPLRWDHALGLAARARAEEIISTAAFEHRRPAGGSFATAALERGYTYDHIAENLAIDFLSDDPIPAAWVASPSHQENLLNENGQHIGVGVAHGAVDGIPTIVVVQLIGSVQEPTQRGWSSLPSSLPFA